MEKELFIMAIEAMKAQRAADYEVACNLQKVFPNTDANDVTHDNSKLYAALSIILGDAVKDTKNWIEYYMFDCRFGEVQRKITVEGEPFELKTAEDLFKLIQITK